MTFFSHSTTDSKGICLQDVLLSLLLAIVFLVRNGTPVGVGNQTLHLAWLTHLIDPSLLATDPQIASFNHFPSSFYPVLAFFLPSPELAAPALAVLQGFNTMALFVGLCSLARLLTPHRIGAWLALVLPALGPFNALAETPLPPTAFSHTALGLTMSVWCLVLGFRGRFIPGLILLGLLVNVHLLAAAFTAALLGVFLCIHFSRLPWKRLWAGAGMCLVLSSPILFGLLTSSGGYDAEWLSLLRERSAHHVFPSAWWEVGNPAWGRFAVWMGWLTIALAGLKTVRSPRVLPLIVGPLILMGIGTLGSEWIPVPLILRAQCFRASIYLLILSFLLVPSGLMQLGRGLPRWLNQGLAALFILCIFSGAAQPGLSAMPVLLLPVAGFLSWWQRDLRGPHALILAAVLVLLTVSDLQLKTSFWALPEAAGFLTPVAGLICGLAVFMTGAASANRKRGLLPAMAGAILICFALFPLDKRSRDDSDWKRIQRLARERTPVDARIITPIRRDGFRVGSRRAIAGEWRDGTMQFFDPAFASAWRKRMRLLEPGEVESFGPEEWVEMGEALHSGYVLLPAGHERGLIEIGRAGEWVLAKTERPPPPPLPPAPKMAKHPDTWKAQKRFLLETVHPNIERHRMSRARLRISDPSGNPVAGLPIQVKQVSRDFGIGSALHHFAPVQQAKKGHRAPQVHAKELELFTDVFNYSTIGFSGKWRFVEPEDGKRFYDDLDRYVEWCDRNGIQIEYHFVTGYKPDWMKKMKGPELERRLMAHANDLIDRYGDRIGVWQIINEGRQQPFAPDVFALFREKLPDAELGVSHCARFFSAREGRRRQRDLKRGWRSMRHIQSQGQTVDYFAVHAHRPFGVWWDPRVIYEVLDDFQEEGVRVRVTETGVPHAGEIKGRIMEGTWTPQLQAEYLVEFLTILYSHPNVDAVNMWGFGPNTWQAHVGLLDKEYNPLPAYKALHTLVNKTWITKKEGRLDGEGRFSLKGFHGGYEVSVSHPDGRTGRGRFDLAPGGDGPIEVSIDWGP